ncbi:hypothetical protein Tco_0357135 [Tanacetum coccineum]
MSLTYQPHFSKGPVTVSDTEPITPSVPTEVKNTKQDSKINELTKFVHMLMDEKINSKTHEQKPESSNSGSSSKVSQDVKSKSQNTESSKSGRPKPLQKPMLKGRALTESSQSSESSIGVRCNTCGITIHPIMDHNDFDHFKRETHQGAHLVPGQWMLKEYDWCQELSA